MPPIRHLEVVDSTNALLKAEVEAGLGIDGAVLRAEHQTSGRGRLDRQWEAPPGKALLFSRLMKLDIPANRAPLIALMTSLAVLDGLQEFLPKQSCPDVTRKLSLKWPNDILLDGRKICGILCENAVDPAGQRFIVAGIGINVNQDIDDLPPEVRDVATSLKIYALKRLPRLELLDDILAAFDRHLNRLAIESADWIAPLWLAQSRIINTQIRVRQGDEFLVGTCRGLLSDGAMILEQKDGSVVNIYSGDVII